MEYSVGIISPGRTSSSKKIMRKDYGTKFRKLDDDVFLVLNVLNVLWKRNHLLILNTRTEM